MLNPSDFLNRTIAVCESTNDLAKLLGEAGAPHGSWVSSRRQTQGRGRQGRSWVSAEGNLFLSILLRFRPEYPMTWIPLYVGYGVLQALEHLDGKPLALKWPNDLFTADTRKKVGGILCEGVAQGSEQFIVAGIGLNCMTAPEVEQETEQLGLEADRIRAHVIETVLETLAAPPSLEDFERRLLVRPGERFSYVADIHSTDAREAVFVGIGPSGELRMRDQQGERSHWSGEIRLKI